LFNSAIGEGSKIMYNRDPRQRVSKAAPWLTLDGDPYPAVIKGRIQWDRGRLHDPGEVPVRAAGSLGAATSDSLNGVVRQENRTIGYIRNSVKATVDAYDGTVSLYSINDNDPVLRAWEGVFPGTVKPSKDVPAELRQHFRYPEDLFKVQRELLARYHVSDPQSSSARRRSGTCRPIPPRKVPRTPPGRAPSSRRITCWPRSATRNSPPSRSPAR